MRDDVRPTRTYLPLLVLVLLVSASAIRDAIILFHYQTAVGVNGYYYVLQVSQIANTGKPYYPTHFPVQLYCLTAAFVLLRNAVVTVKMWGIFLQSVLGIAVFGVLKRATGSGLFGLLGLAITVIPRSRFYSSIEYINQLGAMALLVASGWAILTVSINRRLRAGMIVAAPLISALASHKSILVFALILSACVAILLGWRQGPIPRLLAGCGAILLWFGPALALTMHPIGLPESIAAQVSWQPHFPLDSQLWPEELMVGIAALGILTFIVLNRTQLTRFHIVFGSLALWSVVVTLNPFFNSATMLSSVAGRSRIFSYVQIALLLPGLIWLVASKSGEAAVYVLAAFFPLILISALAPFPYGLQASYLAKRAHLIHALPLHLTEIPQHSIVVAPHGDQFVITATVGLASQQTLPNHPDSTEIYWLLSHVEDRALSARSIVLTNDNSATVLINSRVLGALLPAMDPVERFSLYRANPHLATAVNGGDLWRERGISNP